MKFDFRIFGNCKKKKAPIIDHSINKTALRKNERVLKINGTIEIKLLNRNNKFRQNKCHQTGLVDNTKEHVIIYLNYKSTFMKINK